MCGPGNFRGAFKFDSPFGGGARPAKKTRAILIGPERAPKAVMSHKRPSDFNLILNTEDRMPEKGIITSDGTLHFMHRNLSGSNSGCEGDPDTKPPLFESQQNGTSLGESFCCDANSAIWLRIVRELNGSLVSSEPFHPEFSHQIFGENQVIRGYKGLKINIHYSALSLRCFLDIYFDEISEGSVFCVYGRCCSVLGGIKHFEIFYSLDFCC